MPAAAAPSPSPAALPALDLRLLTTLLTAGAFATFAFDLFGQALSPLFGFAKLAPSPLAAASMKVLFGWSGPGVGSLVHYMTGLLAYPVGWLFIARPLAGRLTPRLPWFGVAAVYGVGLWVFALYVMAHLVAGNPPFLGFAGIAWVALWGHILFALVAAWVVEIRERA
ncbi:MAG: hypothetical protein AAF192_06075 [Pseudomonadota bacterium]